VRRLSPKNLVFFEPMEKSTEKNNSGGDVLSVVFDEGKPTQVTWYDIVCADCGKSDKVSFKPDPNRPVYCHACHRARRLERAQKEW